MALWICGFIILVGVVIAIWVSNDIRKSINNYYFPNAKAGNAQPNVGADAAAGEPRGSH